jgi:hypothetical protein
VRALVRADDLGLLVQRVVQDLVALDLGVEDRLQLLEGQDEVEDRDVARILVLLGERRCREGREQRAAAHERAAQDVGPRAALQPPERRDDDAVAVDALQPKVAHRTNPVRSTAARAAGAEIPSSRACGAGTSPAMSRIHAAWRASTEMIREASARVSSVMLGAAPL